MLCTSMSTASQKASQFLMDKKKMKYMAVCKASSREKGTIQEKDLMTT